jgi:hypothetical protein
MKHFDTPECARAAELLGVYTDALTTVKLLAWDAGARLLGNSAHNVLVRARREYWEHVRAHGCRRRPIRQEGNG